MEEKDIIQNLKNFYQKQEEKIAPHLLLKSLHRKTKIFYFKRAIFIYVLFIATFTGVIRSLENLIMFFQENNTLEFISLIFSDSKAILSNLEIYIFSLLETIPLLQIAYTLLLTTLWVLTFVLTLETLKIKKVKRFNFKF